jgi:hypothetical protein
MTLSHVFRLETRMYTNAVKVIRMDLGMGHNCSICCTPDNTFQHPQTRL